MKLYSWMIRSGCEVLKLEWWNYYYVMLVLVFVQLNEICTANNTLPLGFL